MDTKRSFGQRALGRIGGAWRGIGRMLRALLGEWDYAAPPWMERTRQALLANPRRTLNYAVALVAVAAFAWWWAHRPQPYTPPSSHKHINHDSRCAHNCPARRTGPG